MASETGKTGRTVACQQVLQRDGSVYSVQWMDLPEESYLRIDAPWLLDRYLGLVRDFTRSVVRPVAGQGGVQFRLFSTSLALLSFAPPEHVREGDGKTVRLRINGGLLVQPKERDCGTFSLSAQNHPGALRVTVELAGFCPRLLGSRAPSPARRLLYRLSQAYIHKLVTVRYLSLLCRDLLGQPPRLSVQKVLVREGIET